MCFLRHLDEEPCFEVLKQACDHKDKIIGVGLDSSEKGNPPAKFKKLFEQAMKEGFTNCCSCWRGRSSRIYLG